MEGLREVNQNIGGSGEDASECTLNKGGSEYEILRRGWGAPRRGGGSKINWWRLVQGFLHFWADFKI